jgi:phosphoribosyl-dephospho-CoA transferase
MKKILLLGLLAAILLGCATHSGYDTFQARESEYTTGSIALQEGGLTSEQIEAIRRTRLTSDYPVDISLILIRNGYIDPEQEKILISSVVDRLKKNDKIARVIPVPDFLVPQKINFAKIQELGIRTLSEYVLILYLDARTLFKWTVIIETEYEIESVIDYLLVDSQTTAIMATDKLYSKVLYKANIFKPHEREKAQEEIFSEQGEILGEKMKNLFQ